MKPRPASTAEDDEKIRRAVQILLFDPDPRAKAVSTAMVESIDRHRRQGGCLDAIDGRCPAALAAELIIHDRGRSA